jgi:hypothetical protein
MGIVVIISSLLLVGIQAVRESSRRVACTNNLHQVGVALSAFVGATGRFPSLVGRSAKEGDKFSELQTSFVALLLMLELPASSDEGRTAGFTEAKLPPPLVYRCPSSNEYLGYRYSFGSNVNTRIDLNGIISVRDGVLPAQITDGLTNTAAISERLSSPGEASGNGIPPRARIIFLHTVGDAFIESCREAKNRRNFVRDPGIDWRGFQPVDVGYNHFYPPNAETNDCQGITSAIVLPARSNHRGGVNSVRADGSVHFVSSAIDTYVWRAVGTIAGGEAVPH